MSDEEIEKKIIEFKKSLNFETSENRAKIFKLAEKHGLNR